MKSRGLRKTRPAPPELYGRSGFAPPRAGRQTRTFTPIKRKKTVQPKGHTAISEKILQVFKLNFMNKVNTMKKIFFSSFLCGLFLTITTLFGVEKIYISNGYLNYCLSPDVANSAVVFYSLDIRDGEWKQSYLPMTIVPEIYTKYDRNKQIIKFPLAWYMNRKELLVVFHDLHSDAMGRVIFCLFSTGRTRDFDFRSFTDYYEYQNNIMKYKGFYFVTPQCNTGRGCG